MNRSRIFSLAIGLAILALWEMVCRGFLIPDFILPMPSQILTVAVARAGILLPHAAVTGMEVLAGITLSLMVAVPLSIVMFARPAMEQALAPFLVASQAVPVFAVAPLLVVWLGYGMASKVLMAAVIIFFSHNGQFTRGLQELRSRVPGAFSADGGQLLENLAIFILALGAASFFCGSEGRGFGGDDRRRDWRMGRRAAGPWLFDDPSQRQTECRPGLCRHLMAFRHGAVIVGICWIFGT